MGEFVVIYDYVGEEPYDTCRGVEAKYDTSTEAAEFALSIKDNPNCCNIGLIQPEF